MNFHSSTIGRERTAGNLSGRVSAIGVRSTTTEHATRHAGPEGQHAKRKLHEILHATRYYCVKTFTFCYPPSVYPFPGASGHAVYCCTSDTSPMRGRASADGLLAGTRLTVGSSVIALALPSRFTSSVTSKL